MKRQVNVMCAGAGVCICIQTFRWKVEKTQVNVFCLSVWKMKHLAC